MQGWMHRWIQGWLCPHCLQTVTFLGTPGPTVGGNRCSTVFWLRERDAGSSEGRWFGSAATQLMGKAEEVAPWFGTLTSPFTTNPHQAPANSCLHQEPQPPSHSKSQPDPRFALAAKGWLCHLLWLTPSTDLQQGRDTSDTFPPPALSLLLCSFSRHHPSAEGVTMGP